MPRFYFHVSADDWAERDDHGSELADLAAARRHAAHLVCEIARNDPDGLLLRAPVIDVTDRVGLVLTTLQFVLTDAPAARAPITGV